ncbi:MAG: GerMN domain-containing protein [Acidobacteriota bacterium]
MKLFYMLFALAAFTSGVFAQKAQTMTIKVYFHSDKIDPEWNDCKKVYPVARIIPETPGVATAALQAFLKGPTQTEEKEFSGFSAPETNGILKSVKVKNGGAYVNLTKSVYEQMGNATTSCGGGFFSGVDATLMQFPTIKKVYYAIEGNTNDFYEWVQVGECPYTKKICASSNF